LVRHVLPHFIVFLIRCAENNSASVDQVAKVAKKFNTLALKLKGTISMFKVWRKIELTGGREKN